MSIQQPVFPAYGTGVSIVTGTGAAASGTVPKDSKQLLLTAITNNCYVRVTNSDDTTNASVADLLVTTGSPRLISKGEQTRISALAVGGAGSLHVIGADGATSI